jgi:hypothetical protein
MQSAGRVALARYIYHAACRTSTRSTTLAVLARTGSVLGALDNPTLKLDAWLGKEMEFGTFKFVIDQERIDRVQLYVDRIRAEPGQMWVEKTLNTTPVLGVPGQEGHADVVKLNFTGRKRHRRPAVPRRGQCA